MCGVGVRCVLLGTGGCVFGVCGVFVGVRRVFVCGVCVCCVYLYVCGNVCVVCVLGVCMWCVWFVFVWCV